MNTDKTIKASWFLELNCDCPKCGQYVDLTSAPDFWDGNRIGPVEYGTPRTTDMEVICPECGHGFQVDCEY
jgi:uncharacterized protein (DUF983 family)